MKYPALSVADLLVFEDGSSTVSDSDSCTAYSNGDTGDNYFYADRDLTTEVTSSSNELYFDGRVCAADATWDGRKGFYFIEKDLTL